MTHASKFLWTINWERLLLLSLVLVIIPCTAFGLILLDSWSDPPELLLAALVLYSTFPGVFWLIVLGSFLGLETHFHSDIGAAPADLIGVALCALFYFMISVVMSIQRRALESGSDP